MSSRTKTCICFINVFWGGGVFSTLQFVMMSKAIVSRKPFLMAKKQKQKTDFKPLQLFIWWHFRTLAFVSKQFQCHILLRFIYRRSNLTTRPIHPAQHFFYDKRCAFNCYSVRSAFFLICTLAKSTFLTWCFFPWWHLSVLWYLFIFFSSWNWESRQIPTLLCIDD